MQLVCIPPHQAKKAWDLVGHHIVKAMQRGGVGDAGPVYADVVAGRSLLWVACDQRGVHAAAVTEITEHNEERLCTIVACGGADWAKWLHYISDLENYARAEGCARSRIIGRRGWLRALQGYRAKATVMEKAL